jgi:hypothetical protein
MSFSVGAAAEAEQTREMLRLTQEEAAALKAEVEVLARRLHEATAAVAAIAVLGGAAMVIRRMDDAAPEA